MSNQTSAQLTEADIVCFRGQGARISTAAVERVEASLKEWKRSLPPKMSLANIHPRDSDYRVTLHIYLNYYYAWIAMGKVSVVTVIRAHLRQYLGHEPEVQTEPAVRDLSTSCIKAATKILRLFEMLTSTGNIVRFSFTDFQGCSIATIVTLLAGILERDSGYEARVSFGLDCLRKMATGNMTAKVGVRFVEALQSIADEAVSKLRRNEASRGSSLGAEQSAATAALEYTRWAQWLSRTTDRASRSGNTTPPVAAAPQTQTELPVHLSNAEPMQPPLTPAITAQREASSSWDPAVGVEDPMNPPGEAQGNPFTGIAPGSGFDVFGTDDGLSATLYGDPDQNFLMGLTGLDVLDFSELATPL